MNIARGLLGIVVLLAILWVLSLDRRAPLPTLPDHICKKGTRHFEVAKKGAAKLSFATGWPSPA